MKKQEGLTLARTFKDALHAQGINVQKVFVFGSVAKGKATKESDLDIAVVCEPFAETRHDENMVLRRARRDIDVRIEPICLHPEDFEQKFFALPQEIDETGIAV